MENMFEPDDRMTIQQAAYPSEGTYNKATFNRAVQELVATRRAVGVSDATSDRFRKLLAWLKEKLER
jgi:hypothetical protein